MSLSEGALGATNDQSVVNLLLKEYNAYTICDEYYSSGKVGVTNGTVAGTGVVITPPSTANSNDLRGNTFRDNRGFPMFELCNRNGTAGQKGAGDHYVLRLPLASTLPPMLSDLSVISNPRATVSVNGLLYFQDYDINEIQAVEMCNWTIVQFGEEQDLPAFTYDMSPLGSAQCCGQDLVALVEGVDPVTGLPITVLYALFSNGDSYGGPWDNGTLVRLLIDDTEENRGQLSFANQVEVGKNPNEISVVLDYLPDGTTKKRNILLVSAIGGTQESGGGNGANSMVTVIEAGANLAVVGSPVLGTFVSAASGYTLDLKSLVVTPLQGNDGFVYIMVSSYDGNWQTDWRVVQGRISFIIELAYKIQAGTGVATDIGDEAFDLVADGAGYSGYFWGLLYSPNGDGLDGKLFIGYGFDPTVGIGDQMRVFDVNSGGFDVNSQVDIGSAVLYGSNDPCHLNTFTAGYTVGGVSGSKSIRVDRVAMEAARKAKAEALAKDKK
jgi:hypothetical protein